MAPPAPEIRSGELQDDVLLPVPITPPDELSLGFGDIGLVTVAVVVDVDFIRFLADAELRRVVVASLNTVVTPGESWDNFISTSLSSASGESNFRDSEYRLRVDDVELPMAEADDLAVTCPMPVVLVRVGLLRAPTPPPVEWRVLIWLEWRFKEL